MRFTFLIAVTLALNSLAFAADSPIKRVVVTLENGQQITVDSPDRLPAAPPPLKIGRECNCPQQQERLAVPVARRTVVIPGRTIVVPDREIEVADEVACVPVPQSIYVPAQQRMVLVPAAAPACVPAAGMYVPADSTVRVDFGLFGLRRWEHHADGSIQRHGPLGQRQIKAPTR